ncbi:MAG: exported protein of unknown function [Promethearchaeota archaeon]|nr:MAG: exported protein of unknown function [Candidatus Lokiarchaeota archaeon]
MKKIKNYKSKILVCLILLQSFLAFGIYLIPAHGDENIPEDSPNNDWYWDINVGEKLIFEIERTMRNSTNQNFINATKLLQIYNITSFSNVTFNQPHYDGSQSMSKINASECFWNASSLELVPFRSEEFFAYFGYNESSSIPEKYYTQNSFYVPFILPINGTSKGLQIDLMADILNRSQIYPMFQAGYLNRFDNITTISGTNNHKMIFKNTTDGYYYNLTFYNNGTLKSADIKIRIYYGPSLGYVIIEQKMTQVFSMDDTDNVEWAYDIGESYFYDTYGEEDAFRTKVEVDSISNITESFILDTKTYYRNFEIIFGDIYQWNGTEYSLEVENVTLGAANNFYPANPSVLSECFTLFPDYTDKKTLEFIFNEHINKIFPGDYKTASVTELGEELIIFLKASDDDIINITIDKNSDVVSDLIVINSTGGLEFYLTEVESDVDWGYEAGNVLYVKINDDDGNINKKILIEGWKLILYNLTYLQEQSGGLFIPPSGQPELQFLNVLFGDFYDNMKTLNGENDIPIGVANSYWPFFPVGLMDYANPYYPFVLPVGTTPESLECLNSFADQLYGKTTITNEYIEFSNSTGGKEYLKICIDSDKNLIKYMSGWVIGESGNWRYFSTYLKTNQTLNSGMQTYQLISDQSNEAVYKSTTNVTTSGSSLYYSILKNNPTNETIGNGTILNYLDLFIDDTNDITSFTFSIEFNTINPFEDTIYFYAFDMSGNKEWNMPPPGELEKIILEKTSNSIKLNFSSMNIDSGFIFAITYELAPDPDGQIPGFPLFILIFAFMGTFALIGIINHRKIIIEK